MKFGWCMVYGNTPHVGCIRKFKSTQNGKTYECSCSCHHDNDKALEELI
jgi:hypothetical protein